MPNKKAIILLSGGLDSATCLAYAKAKGFECYCLSFDYGQRHKFELKFANIQAKIQKAKEHKIAKIDLSTFGTSALTDSKIKVPKNRTHKQISKEIPITYVPARNTIFLSYALAYAEVIKAHDIFIGVNSIDYSGYPDCRPKFIKSFEKTANLATAEAIKGNKIKIQTPLLKLSKAEIIKLGLQLGVDYSKTISCYDPDKNGIPCGKCDACQLRDKGFKELTETKNAK
jgi:7-cyano-7-deazaguanine synthase